MAHWMRKSIWSNHKVFINLGHLDKVCLLAKAIYGLQQDLCTWNIQFHGVLLELSFMHMYSNAGIVANY